MLALDEPFQIVEAGVGAPFDLREVQPGNDALPRQRLAGQQFDLQPDLQLVFVGRYRPHFPTRVARDHRAQANGVAAQGSRVECMAAMQFGESQP